MPFIRSFPAVEDSSHNNKLINIFNKLLEYRKSKGLNNTKTIIGNLLEVLKPYNEEQKEKIIKKTLNKPIRKETNNIFLTFFIFKK